ncbi:MAG: molybdenum cofactor guanylyltransferase [Gemmatimonadales bacterium]
MTNGLPAGRPSGRPATRAALIAGGLATRMGGLPKGLLEVGGTRILDRLVEAVVEAFGAPPLLVANAPESAGWRADLRAVSDTRPGGGVLSGLLTAVLETPAPVVCVAWDMPFVPAALLVGLAEGLSEHDVCLPASGGRRGVEPLCAAYGPGCAEPIERAIARGDLRAIAFHDEVRVRVLPEEQVRRFGDPARLFFNVNTADDLALADRMV